MRGDKTETNLRITNPNGQDEVETNPADDGKTEIKFSSLSDDEDEVRKATKTTATLVYSVGAIYLIFSMFTVSYQQITRLIKRIRTVVSDY